MSAPVTCPSCRSAVSIPADHAESTIRCGICWTEVDAGVRPKPPAVPVVAPQPAVPPIAVAKRTVPEIPGKPLPGMAKLEERMRHAAARLAPPLPTPAAPVRATVVAKPAAPLVEIAPAIATIAPAFVEPMPIAEISDAADRPARPSRTRSSRRRDRDDDDDFDRPCRRSREKPKGNPLPLILGIGGGILVLVGGVYLIARATRGPSDRDLVPVAMDGNNPQMQFNLPNVDQNPAPQPPQFGFNPFPNLPNMQPPGANPPAPKPIELVAYNGDGFTAKLFGNRSDFPTFLNLQDDAYFLAQVHAKRVGGRLTPPVATIEITTADAPQGVTPDLKKILTESGFRRGEPKAVKWAGHDGFELLDDFAGRKTNSRAVQVGCRVFLATFTITGAFGDATAAETAKKEFFDSFAITFDANTPAPAAEPGLIPRNRFPVPRPPTPPKVPKPKLPGQP